MVAPHAEQRHAVIHFRRPPQPSAALGAAAALQASEHPNVVARAGPEIPRHDAGRMPGGVAVGTAPPQVDVPAEPIHRLAAKAAVSGAARKSALAIGRRWKAERGRTSVAAAGAKLPRPARRRAGARRE